MKIDQRAKGLLPLSCSGPSKRIDGGFGVLFAEYLPLKPSTPTKGGQSMERGCIGIFASTTRSPHIHVVHRRLLLSIKLKAADGLVSCALADHSRPLKSLYTQNFLFPRPSLANFPLLEKTDTPWRSQPFLWTTSSRSSSIATMRHFIPQILPTRLL